MADIGEHKFTYSLYPHEGDCLQSDMISSAYQLNDPLSLLPKKFDKGMKMFFFSSDAKIIVDAIKESDDKMGIILRLHDYTGGRQSFSIDAQFCYGSVYEANLMEEKEKDIDLKNVVLHPFEIKTIFFDRQVLR